MSQHFLKIYSKFILALCVSLCAILAPMAAGATTHYVDWSTGNDGNDGLSKATPWQRAPGMRGFSASYLHEAGDQFVFKGGIVWPFYALPMAIAGSGAAGAPDTYTTDRSWYAGNSWSQPALDGGGTGTQLITATARRFVTINDLALLNMDVAASSAGGYAVQFENCTNLTLTNNRVRPFCWRGIYIVGYDGTTQNNIVIRDNDISDVSVGITVATAVNSNLTTVINNVDISGNHIHDFTSMMVNNVHGDGIQIWTTRAEGASPSVSGKIYNNTFSGSVVRFTYEGNAGMTAWIYLGSHNGDFSIFNNVLSYSDLPTTANLFEALISVRDSVRGTTQIYNNTLEGTDPGMSAGILVDNSRNVTVLNNIISGMKVCYFLQGATGFFADYNLLNGTIGSNWVGVMDGGWPPISQWRAFGNDTHTVVANPRFLSSPDDLRLRSGSAALGAGANLSASFTTDRDGWTRTAPWDIGAYAGAFAGSTSDSDADLGNRGGGEVVKAEREVAVSPDGVPLGGTITVNWTAPAGGDIADWIGLYSTTDRETLLDWRYTLGATSGTIAFPAPRISGIYNCTYFQHNSYTALKVSNPVTVGDGIPGGSYIVAASPGNSPREATITVQWAAPAGSSAVDWIGLYSTSDRNTLLDWKYTNGATSGTMYFTAPSDAGSYDFTYFLRNSYHSVKTGNTVQIN